VPRVIVKLASVRSEQQKAKLTEDIVKAVMRSLKGHYTA
jgi:phenylpyruvate tautomerase PptA (4-oxalocrotonate tautomerase family)